MVPSNILVRTFHVQHNGSTGTAFTIEIDRMQFLVTAKHVVSGLADNSSLQIMRDGKWDTVLIGQVLRPSSGADLALISLTHQLSASLPVSVGDPTSFFLSQQVYFLGFPFGLHMSAGLTNNNYPIPFVKAGIVSSWSESSLPSRLIYCDGYNNPGFSGGPLITISPDSTVNIIGVISGYRYDTDKVYLNGKDTGLTYRGNTGIIIAYGLPELIKGAVGAKSAMVSW